MTFALLAGSLPEHQQNFTVQKKKENPMKSLIKPSEKVVSRYIEALKSQFPETVIDAGGTARIIAEIEGVAASEAGEFIAKLFFKFDLAKVTKLSILPAVLPPNASQDEAPADPDGGSGSVPEEAVEIANDILSIPKVAVCVETVAKELLEQGEIVLPVAWITAKYPEIYGLAQTLEELEKGFGE